MTDENTQLDELEQELPDEGQELEEGESEVEGAQPETQTPEAQPAEEVKPEAEFLSDQLKTTRDRYSVAKKEADIGRQILRDQETEGLLDRDEAAAKRGMTRAQFDAYLDHKSAPEPGEDGFVNEADKVFSDTFNDERMQKALVRQYGTKEEQMELLKAFDWMVQNDPQMAEKRLKTPGDELLFLALDEGKKAFEEFQAAQTAGGPRKLLARIRELEGQLAAKDGQTRQTVEEAGDETSPTKTQGDIDPLAARDARLKALAR